MASGTVSGTYRGYTLRSVWSSTPNTAGNYSDITVTHYLDCASGWALYINGRTNSCTCGEYKEFWSDSISTGGGNTITLGTTTHRVYHDNDGKKTVNLSTTFNIQATISGTYVSSITNSGDITLDNIPRYTSITNFTVSKRNETSFTFNWSTANTVDYVWYSTNNGSSWTGYDVTDGTSGSFTVSGLSPNTTYNCKLRVRRKDSQLTTDSSTVSQTTYKAPSQSLSSKTETSITMAWSCDTTANYIWYSKDNGANWTAVGSVNATSGTYTISGLSANTSYNIKTRVRRSSTSTTYDTSASSQTTYNYPYIKSASTFKIGGVIPLSIYNPLGRSFDIDILGNDDSVICITRNRTNNNDFTISSNASEITAQYQSIPNSKTGTYKVKLVVSSLSRTTTVNGNTYSIKDDGTEVPTFNNFTYRDSNSNVSNVTGNDQVMVKGLSTVEVTVSSANKMVANYSANPSSYSMSMSTLSGSANYSTSDVVKPLGTINASGTQRLNVTAYDTRGLSKTVYKDITVYDYTKPVINATIKRLNDFEADSTIKVSGTYTKLTINNVNKNTITSVQYRYREVGGSWGSWTNLTTTVNNGTFTCSDVVLSLDNTKSFEFEIRATDSLQQTTTNTVNVDIGQAIFFISTNNKDAYVNNKRIVTENHTGNVNINGTVSINNQEILTYDVVDTW